MVMLRLFQVCFYTGVAYTLLSFILGQLLDFSGVGGDIDFDADIDIGLFPIRPVIIAAFITVFGGTGMILLKEGRSSLTSLICALAIGFGAAYLMYRFIIMPLQKAQNTSAVSQSALLGSLAYTTLPMEGKSFGRISYSIEGNTYSAPAKSIDGKPIAKGVPVVIIDIKKNVFLVKEVKGGCV